MNTGERQKVANQSNFYQGRAGDGMVFFAAPLTVNIPPWAPRPGKPVAKWPAATGLTVIALAMRPASALCVAATSPRGCAAALLPTAQVKAGTPLRGVEICQHGDVAAHNAGRDRGGGSGVHAMQRNPNSLKRAVKRYDQYIIEGYAEHRAGHDRFAAPGTGRHLG